MLLIHYLTRSVLLLGLTVVRFNTTCYGQSPSAENALIISYYGETFTHYGLKAGFESVLIDRISSQKPVHHQLLGSASLIAYRHAHHHSAIIFSPELPYRRIGKHGGTFEIAVAPAFMRYFLAGATYQPQPDEQLKKVVLAGRWAFLPTLGISIGKDLTVKRQFPLAWYTRFNFMVQIPYNASYLPRFGIEVGIRYKL